MREALDNMNPGTLYLIPSPLGESALDTILPEQVRAIAARLDTFVVEHPKTARAFLKQIGTHTPCNTDPSAR